MSVDQLQMLENRYQEGGMGVRVASEEETSS